MKIALINITNSNLKYRNLLNNLKILVLWIQQNSNINKIFLGIHTVH